MVITNGDGKGGGYSAFEALMAMLLSEKLTDAFGKSGDNKPSADVERIRQSILQSLSEHEMAKTGTNGGSAVGPQKSGQD